MCVPRSMPALQFLCPNDTESETLLEVKLLNS